MDTNRETLELKKCFYCGETADTIDHVVPISYYYPGKRNNGLHLTPEYDEENLVDCCRECNCLASNKVFDSALKKKEHVQEQLIKKYKKIINMPFWSEEEISQMGYVLKKEIKIQQLARKWILNRVNYPIELYPAALFNKEIQKFMEKEL